MHFTIADAAPVLERTPHTLRALLAGLPDAWTESTEGPDTWSPREIVAHLRYADRANWIPRARVVMESKQGNPALPGFDQRGQQHDGADMSLAELLDDFTRLRAENLRTLTDWQLSVHDLARIAHHPLLGDVVLHQLLAAWVAHDLAHIAQISRVMAKQYRDEVGPWRTYLPILDR